MTRKLTLIFALLLLVVGIVGAQDEEPYSLTIMHTNDVHRNHKQQKRCERCGVRDFCDQRLA